MSKKKTNNIDGIIFSTNPEFKLQGESVQQAADISPSQQKLKIRLDTKQRAGKAVTLVQDYQGSGEVLEDLGKKLKTFCGTGGSVKDGIIIIQGDQREKVLQWLLKNGYKQSKKI
jgi:translation initiation factor 1